VIEAVGASVKQKFDAGIAIEQKVFSELMLSEESRLTGILPALFAATGIMIWLRGRHLRRVRVAGSPRSQSCRQRNDGGGHMAEAQDRHLPMLHCNAKFRPPASFAKLGVRRG
jgi:hypothetical protein